MELTACVLTVSDRCARGLREDLSGPAVADRLSRAGYRIVHVQIVPDELEAIARALRDLAKMARLVVSTGGTGLSDRDITPEATDAVCARRVDGIAELMRSEGRKRTPLAALSRGMCGTLGSSLIVNLPGSPQGALESLEAALPVLEHALSVLAGEASHPDSGPAAGN